MVLNSVCSLDQRALFVWILCSGLPNAPESVTCDRTGRDSVTVSWRKPDSDGGSPIQGYIVEKQDSLSFGWERVTTVSAPMTSCDVSYLSLNKDYKFRVSARNKVGVSPPTVGSSITMSAPGEFSIFNTNLKVPLV